MSMRWSRGGEMNSLERVDTSSQDQDHVLGRKIDMVEPEEKGM